MPELKLNGKSYELRFTIRSLKRLEESAGVKITDSGFGDWAGSITGLSVLVWAGLLHDHPDITQDEVDGMVRLEDIGAIGDILEKSFLIQVRSPNGQRELKKLPKPPTGSRRGQLPSSTSD